MVMLNNPQKTTNTEAAASERVLRFVNTLTTELRTIESALLKITEVATELARETSEG